jgi:hypothetical protein
LTHSEHRARVDINIQIARILPIFPFFSYWWSSVYSLARAVITLNMQEFMHSAFHSTAWTFWGDNNVQCLVHARMIIKFTSLFFHLVNLHLVPLVGMSMLMMEAVWLFLSKSMNVELERSFDSKLP